MTTRSLQPLIGVVVCFRSLTFAVVHRRSASDLDQLIDLGLVRRVRKKSANNQSEPSATNIIRPCSSPANLKVDRPSATGEALHPGSLVAATVLITSLGDRDFTVTDVPPHTHWAYRGSPLPGARAKRPAANLVHRPGGRLTSRSGR